MTSVKNIRKRSGEEQAFQVSKLQHSIHAALFESGLKDPALAKRVTGQVISRLTKQFNGHSVPSFADVREVTGLCLIDNNLIHVAKRYAQYRRANEAAIERETYGQGITVDRFFTTPGVHPYDLIEWDQRDASITDSKGNIVFEQKGVEVPKTWSQTATNIVVSKYFFGTVGKSDREHSVRQLVGRVAKTIANWGRKDGYFQTAQDAQTFDDELHHILVNQMAAFNSPVWFNVGTLRPQQCSACFINSVEDDMRSILNLCVTEGMLFKGGSGAGSNLSKIRSRHEYLGGSNGKASGPVSFMKGLDAFAGVIKSGGKTRRAAKMVILDVGHPDIDEFIMCKVKEEKKAWALIDAGYDSSLDGEAYGSISFQNANNSVRVTDEFMQAVEADAEWTTRAVTTGENVQTWKAGEIMDMMSDAAWQCGDPGVQYDTIINKWHTCKNTDRIYASNPCSEYMFLNDSACNLASLNLLKFRKEENGELVFDVESFKKANEIIITAMEIIVGNSAYPTPAIEQNSQDYRPLGIGYANLGALLMSRGLPYDSAEGRNLAAAITSLQSGHCYYQSSKIAEKVGPFVGYQMNAEPAMEVMRMHRDASYQMLSHGVPADLLTESRKAWDNVVEHGSRFGLRNAQISVLAPTGTISFLMDCDTTGVEPDIALVKYKWLVGGGMIKIVNNTVDPALTVLGYTDGQKQEIMAYIEETDTIEGAPHLKEEHLPVFDCAFKAANGTRTIHYMGHVRMMAAVQPFISGAISKTVNMPHNATKEEIAEVYMEGWKMGLKAIAIYRDGSKRQQALTTSKESDAKKQNETTKSETVDLDNSLAIAEAVEQDRKLRRHRLPDERRSITHKFAVGNHEGYITVGLYNDGTPGELFVTMSKEGSVISGLIDSFATSISIGLQYGVPLEVLVNKFVHMRFEPSGYTNNPQIRIAKSITDYLFRWLAIKFLSRQSQLAVGVNATEGGSEEVVGEVEEVDVATIIDGKTDDVPQATLFETKSDAAVSTAHTQTFDNQSDAPACDTCGSMMVRNAACYKCLNCGATSGCS
ncbi:ribonucleoside-diphosphate reductase, adenosylcobalamin-dependent [Candidatus Uhrbacteria bacterium CG_4_9_14_3_um_filter_50_9]|uniref:Vitamin B12-dependent ribonucleotide reductase n=1 Tax=Candidatus Uhrbacteria bacterium CG_4_9_14_3_um_filter_50_9 TaxID=1975035 RepID=A0A2M7XC01_9BACT|nr:MAG: ribonucleoside-diphosphate reductase, adenosylcobalamin-dependent [Candidatus Uhrbacteria bacterium CG_4_9_14_3_um_filter_50_9]